MNLHEIVDKAMVDRKLYEEIRTDPAAALGKLGVTLTKEQIDALKKINWVALDYLATVFGERLT